MELMRGFEQVVSWFLTHDPMSHIYTAFVSFHTQYFPMVADPGRSHHSHYWLSSSSSTGGDDTIQPELTTTMKLRRVLELIKLLP